MLKLPKSLESEQDILKINQLVQESALKLVAVNGSFLEAMATARRIGSLVGGLEAIQVHLRQEASGLLALSRRGLAGNSRISRLLLLSNDGAPRFYNECDSLQRAHAFRLVTLKLEQTSLELGTFFGKDKAVKAVLVAEKNCVSRVLLALVR